MTNDVKTKVADIVTKSKKAGIKYVILHYVGVANTDTTAERISWYHKVKLRWSKDGYHLFLNDDGLIEYLDPIGTRVNGCLGTGNTWWERARGIKSNEEYIGVKALHICFETVKGYSMSKTQEEVLLYLFKELIKSNPNILIGGHREFPDYASWNKRQQTLCPGFSVSDWLMEKGISKANCFYEVFVP
jgi:hypothetical protein